MTPRVELSKKQEEIVFAENGAIYVKASAGSGKTRVLTERVRYLLDKTNKKVLALTFTNKAGEEIKERLSDISEIDNRVFVGTFHSFCQSILENHGNLIGRAQMPHIFEDESDRLELVEQAIMQTPSYAEIYKNKSKQNQIDYRYSVLSFISKVKRELISDSELGQHTTDDNLVLIYHNYREILDNQNAIDFDDLLFLAHNLLVNYPKTAALYRRSFFAICIDEAQDLNNAQYQLLLALVNGEFNNIIMVGDSNQSIYNFNGSSPKYMDEQFVHDFDPVAVIKLNENYRSSKEVLLAAKKIIPDESDISETVKEGIFKIHCLKNEHDEAQWVVDKINELLTAKTHDDIEGEITLEKIAVLARNKYIFNQLENLLTENNLPFYYKMTPGMIRFESDLMKIFDLSLRVRLNPLDDLHKQRLLNYLNIKNSENMNLESMIPLVPDELVQNLILLVTELHDDGSNIKQKLESFRDTLTVNDENEKNMIFNDITEILNHWHNYAKKTDNKSLHQFKNAMALGKTHPLTQHSGITLSTVHTMKGQEFDIVFIIGMDDETFPDYRAVRSGGIELIQEKNNLYVAFTRAKRFLYVT
ncbi:ATP-dependent helicase [Methanococcoides burtonii]|uniref:DNA 3'-5' helicase n=1 Tax=Methanococcoides burtonii (strain DSM 6242 / NBRC 107633 / OCM 468 / ACE-M) TaxID=259564 RepID=Q12XW1_METBU|nr:ATP-dependent helicase [Methanococcoides burtonii]ABE51715.1 DNA helicase, ATP dependent [Methanococcoides burtonii DSM 6242]